QEDFEKLDAILEALNYPSGAFVNVADARTHAEHYSGAYPGRIHCFAVERTSQGIRVVHARPSPARDARARNVPAPGAPPIRGGPGARCCRPVRSRSGSTASASAA